MTSLRLTAAAVLLATAAAACGGAAADEPFDTRVDDVAVRISTLHGEMAEVAATQQAADGALAAALSASRQLEEAIASLRDPERVDGVRDSWPRTDTAVLAVDTEVLRQPLIDLALAVDTTRASLRRTREVLEEEWEHAYLDAADEVLTSVRTYAESTDKLAQILIRHWPAYVDAHLLAAQFVEQRWFYRSGQEAADAFEVKVQGLLPPLVAAREELAEFVVVREAAAEGVNAASAAASEAWSQRPSPSATP